MHADIVLDPAFSPRPPRPALPNGLVEHRSLSIGVGQSADTALAGGLAEQPLASAALPAAGAALALAVLLATRRRLSATGQLPRGRDRRPLRGRHKTP